MLGFREDNIQKKRSDHPKLNIRMLRWQKKSRKKQILAPTDEKHLIIPYDRSFISAKWY